MRGVWLVLVAPTTRGCGSTKRVLRGRLQRHLDHDNHVTLAALKEVMKTRLSFRELVAGGREA